MGLYYRALSSQRVKIKFSVNKVPTAIKKKNQLQAGAHPLKCLHYKHRDLSLNP